MTAAALARRRGNGCYGYLSLPGTSGRYASAPDAAAVSVTGDIDLRVRVALDDWTPATDQVLVSKWGSAGQRSYGLYVAGGAGVLSWEQSLDGTAQSFRSGTATSVADGAVKWVRMTRASSTGQLKFYLSDDGSTWNQLGSDGTSSAGALFDSTAPLEVGTNIGGTNGYSKGKFYQVQIRNNILDDTSGIVFNANFTNTGRSFVEPASGATVTVNGTTARASVYP